MKAATWPRDDPEGARLLVVGPQAWRDASVRDLPAILHAGDLLVVNDAATLPASLRATSPRGRPIEVRLAGENGGGTWRAVLFGEGDWRTRTEDRPLPEAVAPGDLLSFGEIGATVVHTSPLSARLVDLRFDASGAALHAALHRLGKPVQYAHVSGPLAPWHVQTSYASRPWAVELPSAGRPLRWGLVLALRRAGIRFATVTHAAGLSATGDAALDAALPLPERFEVPEETAARIASTRAQGGRVIAVGTSVVRALESAGRTGIVDAGSGETDLVIRPGYRPRIVEGLLTGIHEPGTSHFDLCRAFAAEGLLRDALAHAEHAGYEGHEFGDSALLLPP